MIDNMMPMTQIPIGAQGEMNLLVTGDVAVDFLDNEEARVLGTPFLIGFMELAARNAVKDFIGEAYDTVGTHVDVRHLAATPVGMGASFHAEVTAVNERRVSYRIWARDEKDLIAEGTHERYIISVERFAGKVQAKARRE